MQQADLAQQYPTVRFFPNGTRNCYTLQSLTPGGKYLVRAAFGYGDYDTLNRPPTFDLYFGVNYWTTVTIVNTSTAYLYEIIVVAPAKFLHICLVDRGSGTPFISVLELRSLVPTLYPVVSLAQSLVLLSFFRDTVKFGFNCYHFGTDDKNIRYPDDPYDRMWQKYEDVPNWIDVPNKTDGVVQNAPNDHYGPLSAVMRSASSLLNASRMDMWWSSDSSLTLDVGSNYFLVLYFTELEDIQVGFRQFHVSVDNYSLADAFSPTFFRASVLSWTVPSSSRYVVSLIATPNSTLGPVISGMEIYMLRQQNESTTYSADANAMMTIQMKFSVKKNWVGDPCSPVFFAWDGLECRYAPSSPRRITALNLSSSGLAAEVDISVGQLKLLQYLDLSHNKLSGSIPEFLGELTSLKYLDLSNNNFSGPIPGALLEKSQNGLLVLRVDNNPNLCGNYTCNKKKNKITGVLEIIVPVISSIALLSVVLLVRCTE